MKYELLSQVHPDYDGALYREIDELYKGGYRILRNAKLYMPQMQGESAARYEERIRCASYMSYLQQIVGSFASNLFAQDLAVIPPVDAPDDKTPGEAPIDERYYAEFARNCDRKGTAFSSLMKLSFTMAVLKKRALVAVDFPKNAGVESRAEEELAGLDRAYCFDVPIEQLIDWKVSDTGDFEWAVLYRCFDKRDLPFSPIGIVCEEWKLWYIDPSSKRAAWRIFRAEHKAKDRLKPEDEVPEVDGGLTTFESIPLLSLSVPDDLWIGNKIGPLAKEHFQDRSALRVAQNTALYELPVYKLGPEMSAPGQAIPAEVQQDPNRAVDPKLEMARKGFTVIGSNDDLRWVGPSGAAFNIKAAQLAELKNEMFRVVHQLAAAIDNGSANLGRSGASKQEDRRAESIVLKAFGQLVSAFAVRIYTLISKTRGEDVFWTAHGLDKFDVEDEGLAFQEALQVDAIGIPSATFKKAHKTKLAFALLGATSPTTQSAIRQEIEDAVSREHEHTEHMQELEKKLQETDLTEKVSS